MKKVMLLGLLLCLSLALAAPAMAEAPGADKVITHPDQKGSRPTVPLAAHKYLTMRLKAGTANSTFSMKLEPTASGAFNQKTHENVTLSNCKASYAYGAAGSLIDVDCKMTLKDTGKDGYVKYQNDSDGIVKLHIE